MIKFDYNKIDTSVNQNIEVIRWFTFIFISDWCYEIWFDYEGTEIISRIFFLIIEIGCKTIFHYWSVRISSGNSAFFVLIEESLIIWHILYPFRSSLNLDPFSTICRSVWGYYSCSILILMALNIKWNFYSTKSFSYVI